MNIVKHDPLSKLYRLLGGFFIVSDVNHGSLNYDMVKVSK